MRVERDEIDLVDLVLILWNRRLIVIATIILATAAGICTSLVLPPIYSVSAILEPGRDAEGDWSKVLNRFVKLFWVKHLTLLSCRNWV